MGALSSWVLLAITHHVVAQRYYDLVTVKLGVKINLAKSIASKKGLNLEFAKKFWMDGKRATIFTVRDAICCSLSTTMMHEMMGKYSVTFMHYLSFRGLGYKAKSKWVGNL